MKRVISDWYIVWSWARYAVQMKIKWKNYRVDGGHVQGEKSTGRKVQSVVEQFQGQVIYLKNTSK